MRQTEPILEHEGGLGEPVLARAAARQRSRKRGENDPAPRAGAGSFPGDAAVVPDRNLTPPLTRPAACPRRDRKAQR